VTETLEAEPEAAPAILSADVLRIAGITYRQCDGWIRAGHLKPWRLWRRNACGSGSPRIWPPEEVEIATRMGRLTAAGIPPSLAASFARTGWPRGEIAPGIVLEVTS
jgi:hypothetical protein